MHKTLAFAAAACCAIFLPAQQKYAEFQKKITPDQEILHALDRLTFGPRPGDIEAVKKMGLSKWIDLQLHPERIPEDEALAKLVEPLVEPSVPAALGQVAFRLAADVQGRMSLQQMLTPQQIQLLRTGSDKEGLDLLATFSREKVVQALAAMPAVRPRLAPLLDADLRMMVDAAAPTPAQPGQILSQGKLYRALQSDRQLEEVLVDFWYNHFNVDAGKGSVRAMVTAYERDAIRPHVLGKFRELLEATANSPAMLFYLDNYQSSVPMPAPAPPINGRPLLKLPAARGLNENYARELMELHTLGVDGGYSQKDIVEVARCFTGWTIDTPGRGGPFRFDAAMHDTGEKTVLGVTIPAGGGKEDGEKVLDILAKHPSTARFISRELAQRFVADDSPPPLIERMAKTFRDSDGDIRAVLTTMFASKEFFSTGAYRAKLKTPFEMVVSAVRATGAQVENAAPLASQISAMGEPLYRKLEPTGYSNLGSDWTSSAGLMFRMNFAMDLVQNQVSGVKVNPEMFSTIPAAAARQILFADASPQTLSAIGSEQSPGVIAGMLLGSPDFQRR
jgi:uncharacterized protein (DUF1800 family)